MNGSTAEQGYSCQAPSKRDVLVIDDDPQMRLWMRMVLEDHGFAVRDADDGITGLETFTTRRADLVICDIFMYHQEGLSTILTLRKLAPDLPIIAISGGGKLSHFDHLSTAVHFGALYTLRKPFSADELLLSVRNALQGNATKRAPR